MKQCVQVRQITLKRNRQKLILRGMIHAAKSSDLYDNLDKEIDARKKEGYTIFYEGVSTKKVLRKGLSEKELFVFDFLKRFTEEVEKLAKMHGCIKQRHRTPKGAMVADIDLREMAIYLCSKGFCSARRLAIIKDSPRAIQTYQYKSIRKGLDVAIVDYRNYIAVEIILGKLVKTHGHGLAIFGDAHLDGMRKLFIAHGWQVVSSKSERVHI